MGDKFPTISVLMPTWNRERLIGESLRSIRNQNYPQDKIEIIVTDAGSTDRTVKIAKKYGAKVYLNPLITGEAGKAIGLRQAKGDFIAFIDSDNVLPSKEWFKQMMRPFEDKEIIGSEPIAFTYRQSDGFIDRYCALLGMNDPYCLFQGIYDRYSCLTGKWTGRKLFQEDRGEYLKVELRKDRLPLPTIGANGTVFRKSFLKDYQIGDYFYDIDILTMSLEKKEKIYFAKVKNSIVHYYSGADIGIFIKKQERRIKDNRIYRKVSVRHYDWGKVNRFGVLKFAIPTVFTIPLFIQTLIGFFRKKDVAWFFHPLACWLTLLIYSFYSIKSLFVQEKVSEVKRWREKLR